MSKTILEYLVSTLVAIGVLILVGFVLAGIEAAIVYLESLGWLLIVTRAIGLVVATIFITGVFSVFVFYIKNKLFNS